jgi:hypothetical protein
MFFGNIRNILLLQNTLYSLNFFNFCDVISRFFSIFCSIFSDSVHLEFNNVSNQITAQVGVAETLSNSTSLLVLSG